ncbi:hypothetical protein [Actinoplanes sp. NPDC020271]|uniref:hypothetical protein n=1 Tax=Actinoplanes sp. NPDC020271 TaxID=3363896 RepID=UPI003796369A
MLWSGSSPLTATRGGMWGFLMFAAAAWLAIGWSVLRLEPAGIAAVAGPIVLFGAVCEGLRALAGTRTWWLNTTLAALFAATGSAMLLSDDAGWTTTASLIGWYLLVRGAVDVAVGMMTRGADRVWSLIVTVGVVETALGFTAAGPLARSAEAVVMILGGLGVLRAVADLVTALRLREIATKGHDVLELPPERATGLAGYTAGHADFETRKPARHRARDVSASTPAGGPAPVGESFHDRVVRTTADLDAMLAQAGITGPRPGAAPAPHADELPPVPDSPEGIEGTPAGNAAKPDRPAGGH